MTTGQFLAQHSTLPSGTALAHLLALQMGRGPGAVVLAHRVTTVSSEQRLDVFSEPRVLTQQFHDDTLGVSDRDDGVTARTVTPGFYTRSGDERLTAHTHERHTTLCSQGDELFAGA